MVKQIINCDLVKSLIEEEKTYFSWLERKTGICSPLACILAGTDFVSVNGMDDVLMKSAKENMREAYSEEIGEGLSSDDISMIRKSVRGDCCMLEVILYLGESVNDMVSTSSEDETPKYISMMLHNAKFDEYTEEDWKSKTDIVAAYWKTCVQCLVNRVYSQFGHYNLFFIDNYEKSMPDIPLWQQMNDWVDSHTNEEGEWVD